MGKFLDVHMQYTMYKQCTCAPFTQCTHTSVDLCYVIQLVLHPQKHSTPIKS